VKEEESEMQGEKVKMFSPPKGEESVEDRLGRIERALESVVECLSGGDDVTMRSSRVTRLDNRRVQRPETIEWNKDRNMHEYDHLYHLSVDDITQEEMTESISARMAMVIMGDQYGWKVAKEAMGEVFESTNVLKGPVVQGYEKQFLIAEQAFRKNDREKKQKKSKDKRQEPQRNAWSNGPSQQVISPPSPGNQPGPWQRQAPVCYKCKKPGHIATRCWSQQGYQQGNNSGAGFQGHCFHCGKVGHSRSRCQDFLSNKPPAQAPSGGWPKYGTVQNQNQTSQTIQS
jgi:hypothetical protein